MNQLDQIEHFIVLMLENRSFNSVVGKLYPVSANFDGLTGAESNTDLQGKPITVWNSPGTDATSMSIPTPDPGEQFVDINTQLYGRPTPANPLAPPNMSGFAKNYQQQATGNDPKNAMHYFSPEQVPVISRLARICGERPMVCRSPLPNLAEPFLCSHRDRERIRKQLADAFPLHNGNHLQPLRTSR